MEADREGVIANIRACLLSIKGGIAISSLNKDFRILVGTSIPFRELGYDSLESFLRSIPNMSITRRNGELILDAVPTKSSQHLAALVSKQKSVPKKLKAPRMAQRRNTVSQWRPPPRVSRPPQRFTPRFTPRPAPRTNINITVSQNSRQPAERKVSYGDGSGEPRAPNGYAIPPRFLRAPTQNSEPYHKNLQFPVQNHMTAPIVSAPIVSAPIVRAPIVTAPIVTAPIMTAPNIFAAVSRIPTPPLTPVMPDMLSGSIAALNINVTNPVLASVPTLPSPVVPLSPDFVGEPNYVDELRKLLDELGESINSQKTVPRCPKGQPPVYAAVIKIGDTSYNSFPDEDPTEQGAIQLAAKRAFFELMKRSDGQRLPVTRDLGLLINRVSQIVAAHPQGIWNTQIPVDYSDQFKETLPSDWLSVLQQSRCPVLVETVGNNPNRRAILTPRELSSEPRNSPIHLQHQNFVNIPVLALPTEDTWDVYVTCAVSTGEVWVRLIGEDYSVQYEAMATDMEIYYMEKSMKVLSPEIGNFYAIILDGCWHRVCLAEISNEEEGLIYFVDHGDQETYRLDELYVLEPSFAALPSQAVPICLYGLEDFTDDPNADKHLLEMVVGRSLVAEVLSREPVAVILYDTSTDEDINVNEILAEQIFQDTEPPSLPENGEIREVYLSHVGTNGDVFIQIKGDSFKYLELLMEKLNASFSESEIAQASKHDCDPTKVYLAKYSADDLWYRVGLLSRPDEQNQVMVEFIDFGNRERTSVPGVVLVEKFSESLASLPAQALRVRLHNVPLANSPKMADRMREIVPDQEPVLVKVMKGSTVNSLVEVEMFKRTKDKQLVSVNITLALDSELEEKQIYNSKPVDVRARRRLQNQRSLTNQDLDIPKADTITKLNTPAVPGVGSFFDVVVSMAASPSNFVVRPYLERKNLHQLMREMQVFYNETQCETVLPENVTVGSVFAACNEQDDNYWYRATVSNVIGGDTVSVYFCDFGDVSILPLERLAPLHPQFKQLPAQAIKAKLSRIVPIDRDWSVKDCLDFQSTVNDKCFVSIVVDCSQDVLNPSDIVLGLQLIDTSGATDVIIDEMLVQENRAKFIPNISQRNPNTTYG